MKAVEIKKDIINQTRSETKSNINSGMDIPKHNSFNEKSEIIDEESKKLMVMDPAKGKRIMSFSEFKLHSTNNFILLKPVKSIPIFLLGPILDIK